MITGLGTELLLEDAIVDYVRAFTVNDRFKSRPNAVDPSESSALTSPIVEVVPAVYAGMVPRTVTGQVDVNAIPIWPFVLAQLTHGHYSTTDNLTGCIYTRIVCGTYDPDESMGGRRDSIYLINKIYRGIWYEGSLDNSFGVAYQERTSFRVFDSDEISHPFFMAECMIPWQSRLPYIKEENDFEISFPTNADGTQTQPIIRGQQPELQ